MRRLSLVAEFYRRQSMINDDYRELRANRFERRAVMADSKSNEYAKNDDRLANFKEVSRQLGVDPLAVAGVYWYKHVAAVQTFIRRVESGESVEEVEASLSEPIEGRIMDCQEYLDIIAALIQETRD
jgi:hypothetical protein